MSKLRYLIIDDERLAREEMKWSLKPYPDLELLGEATNAFEAEERIKKLQPDLIFLDVQMPGKSGFELLESLDQVPVVIFTTAFDQYAVQAFEMNALDYLVKPVREERLEKAIAKIRQQFHHSQHTKKPAHLFVKEGEKYHFIALQELHQIESIGNYARLYFNNEKVFFKRSLNQLEKILDSNLFFRINRSTIINTGFIEQLSPDANGRLLFRLKNGETHTASSRQSALFKNRNMF
ncbi:LytTR family DNA-binding domain-containing protein [Pedobacter sp.]|uniref:LytR/AlgR family response regulator transcription factor n=1 Tax=Pedobacter sp. TaxID=1411316 RepID=UPI0031D5129A